MRIRIMGIMGAIMLAFGTIAAKAAWFPPATPEELYIVSEDELRQDGLVTAPKVRTHKYRSVRTSVHTPKRAHVQYVQQLIQDWASEYGADPQRMLKIAKCESDFDPVVRNPEPNSTAKGVFQFIDSTWEQRCQGNVLDAADNVRCAAELLALGELSHWKASRSCWGGG